MEENELEVIYLILCPFLLLIDPICYDGKAEAAKTLSIIFIYGSFSHLQVLRENFAVMINIYKIHLRQCAVRSMLVFIMIFFFKLFPVCFCFFPSFYSVMWIRIEKIQNFQ